MVRPPVRTQLQHAYLLPYGSFHEARVNWRPLLFSKFFGLVAAANSTASAMAALVAPNQFLNWTGHPATEGPPAPGAHVAPPPVSATPPEYELRWRTSTTPPVLSPFDFVAYGYGSCSGWATFIVYQARALGIPARQVGELSASSPRLCSAVVTAPFDPVLAGPCVTTGSNGRTHVPSFALPPFPPSARAVKPTLKGRDPLLE